MSTVPEQLAENFRRWEQRGRGIQVFPSPVALEPPFVPFAGHVLKIAAAPADTGARPTLLSRLSAKLHRALQAPASEPGLSIRPQEEEPEPEWLDEEEEPPVEIRVTVPEGFSFDADTMGALLTTLSLASHPVTFEIMASATEVILQFATREDDFEITAQQLAAQLPGAKFAWSREGLSSLWEVTTDSERMVVDFGLHREFMLPLENSGRLDPLVSLIGGMAELEEDEAAVYQVIFAPLRAPWAENAMAAVTRSDGKPFFDDGADLVKQASAKVSRPLYGVTLRLASKAASLPRAWDILRGMAPALRLFSKQGGQSLMPLPSADYDLDAHCNDLLWRRSRRSGMILNLTELAGLVRWPSVAVKCPKLLRVVEETARPAPAAEGGGSILLGINEHGGGESEVSLSVLQRLQHLHCVGASGTGKSTLLLSMILQDLESGQGFALLDPHGDLIDRVLAHIPPERIGDVVLIDPSDEERITPFNVLSAHSEYEKTLLASDLVGVFRRLSTSWGDRMGIIFQNLVLAFLEHPGGGTLADMRRFLVDTAWREAFLAGVDDPDVQFYWAHTFPKLDGPKSVGPILTRLETLLTPKIIRYMVSQKENRIDFGEIMDKGRILLVRLPMGQIGKENAFMLGSLVMVKLQQMAMGRARLAARDRTPFFCYVDECQHFVTPSMAEILAGARKYGLGLILAHQDLHQLSQSGDVAAAVMTNAAIRVVFRVSESDGRALTGDFAHYGPKDFAGLPNLHALCRIGSAEQDFNLRVLRPEDPDPAEAEERRREVIEASRARYTVSRKDVEAEIRRRMAEEQEAAKPSRPGKSAASAKAPPASPAPEAKPPQAEPAPAAPNPAPVSPPASPAPVEPGLALPPSAELAAPAEPEVIETPAEPAPVPGLGRGGADHQLIVARLAAEGVPFGYAARKEATVPNGRVDIALESRNRRLAFEVAVHSNTSHEIDNLRKCLAGGYDFAVSVSPLESVLRNNEKAAARSFTPEELARLRFLLPADVSPWLAALAETDAPPPPPKENTRVIGGRRVRIQRAELSPAERHAMEEQQLEAIAALVNRNRPENPS